MMIDDERKKHRQDRILNLFIVVVALFIALLIGALIFLIAKGNPFKAYGVMFTRPFSSIFGITEILVRAAPLMFVGLGIAIAFRSGILNIGAEGQILIGAITGAAVALAFPDLPKFILIPMIFLASFIGGAIWGGIAGWMRAYLNVNEILSTVMLNYVAIQVYMFLIRGPLIDPKEVSYGTGVPQTAVFSKTAWLTRLIPGTRLHTGIIIAVILAIAVYILLWKTTVGYRMRAVGVEPKAARSAGMNVKGYLFLAMLLSGGFAGMAGAIEITGVHHRALESISAGYGFSGIVVALFGGLHPLGIIPSSIVFGLLIIGSDMMQRAVDVPASIILSIQGLIIMAIVSSQTFIVNPKFKEKILKIINNSSKKMNNDQGGQS
ncbi:MAG: ABC transporter permease [Spirochaetota bacterium]|nr:ABC transporter permease [Spirochaetota bacterium]